jgi:hypothetical protein
VDAFLTKPRRRVNAPQKSQRLRAVAGLFDQFAVRGFDRRLAAFDHAGGDFPQLGAGRMTVLFDQHDLARRGAGDDDDAARVLDDFYLAPAAAARLRDFIDAQIEDAARIDALR